MIWFYKIMKRFYDIILNSDFSYLLCGWHACRLW